MLAADARPDGEIAPGREPEVDVKQAPSFEREIAPLFRDQDRGSMAFAFDLGDYDDVRANAAAIARRTAAGEMPCDSPWPPERVQLFQAWIDGGFAP
jgi:hypothetical protein